MRHFSQPTRKYKPTPFKHKKSKPTPRPLKRIPRKPRGPRIRLETMQLEPMTISRPMRNMSDLSQSYMTNRIQGYLGTQVSSNSPYVSANRLATMPQNYYKLQPNLNRRLVEKNFSYDSRGRMTFFPVPLSLPEFKDELEQLYRKYNITPIPLSPEDEQVFNTRMTRYGYNNHIFTKEQFKSMNDKLIKYGNRPMIKAKLQIPEFPRSPSPESSPESSDSE